jgi:hypothetical protein
MNAILVALGKRLPADIPVALQPKAEPLEELILELTDLRFHEQDGIRRASARARLVYEPAAEGQREVKSEKQWRFIAPIGPIEAEELRWYLEKYAIWPSHYFRDRARKVEENLAEWGKLLHEAEMPVTHTANVIQAWEKIDSHAGRRFSVHVDWKSNLARPNPNPPLREKSPRFCSAYHRSCSTIATVTSFKAQTDQRPSPSAKHARARRASGRPAYPYSARYRASGR